jgi:hypothetical protein
MAYQVDVFLKDTYLPASPTQQFNIDAFLNFVFVYVSGVAITGTVAETQAKQTEAISGQEIYSGSVVESQVKQSEAAQGAEVYSGPVVEAQAKQTEAAVGELTVSGAVAETQAIQTEQAVGSVSTGAITGTVDETQAVQTEQLFGTWAAPLISVTGGAGYTPGTERWKRPKKKKKRVIVPKAPVPVYRPPYEPSRKRLLATLERMQRSAQSLQREKIRPLDREALVGALREAFAVSGIISSKAPLATEQIAGKVTDTEAETLLLSLVA